MFRNMMIAAVAAGSVAGPAFAGAYDEAPAEPVVTTPAPVYTAGTDWTGGYVGGQLGYGNFDVDGVENDGAVYGVQGGYDYDFGSFVLGGEVDYSGAEDGVLDGTDLNSMTRLKMKAGYDAGPALLYGVVGAAFADSEAQGSDNGIVYGVGADYMVTDTVSVGAEYLYHEFDDFNGSGSDINAGTLAARVNYRF